MAATAAVRCIREMLANLALSNEVVHSFFNGKAKVKKSAKEEKDGEELGFGKGHFC